MEYVSKASQPTTLLATKLHRPSARVSIVVRPRLLAKLDASRQHRLTLIAAPAGYGKTTLLASWLQHIGAAEYASPVAWVTLDSGDNDPGRFWSYLIAAFDQIIPGVGTGARAKLAEPFPTTDAMLTALINDLATISSPCTLVLDDYHAIDTPEIHDAMVFLISHLPAPIQLVIASRADPPLPLSRLRARGDLQEIRAADLRFTFEEADLLLNERLGLGLEMIDISTLINRTEGWIAGLHLSAIALQSQADRPLFISELRGSNRYILDYLVDEVLNHQPDELRTFLLRTAILDSLCAELCDALITPDEPSQDRAPLASASQRLLEQLDQANLLVPLDDQRRWYRYHQLFAEFFCARLQQEQPQHIAQLHRRAAGWYEQHGFGAEAINHALAAGDQHDAARMIEQAAETMLCRGQMAMLIQWMGMLPDEVQHSRPRLYVAHAWALVAIFQIHRIEPLVSAAEQAISALNSTDPSGQQRRSDEHMMLRTEIVALRALTEIFHSEKSLSVTLLNDAISQLAPESRFAHELLTGMLVVERTLHSEQYDLQLLESMLQRSQHSENTLLALFVATLQARISLSRGELRHANNLLQQIVPGDHPRPRQPNQLLPMVGIAYIELAEIAYEYNDLEISRRYTLQAIEIGQYWQQTPLLIDAYIQMARIQRAQGSYDMARSTLQQIQEMSTRSLIWPRQHPAFALELERLNIQPSSFAQEGDGSNPHATKRIRNPLFKQGVQHVLQVRQALAAGKIAEANEILSAALATAAENKLYGHQILLLIQRALVWHTRQDPSAANAALLTALSLAEAEGHIRVFVDEGAPMAEMLRGLLASQHASVVQNMGVTPAYIERLLAAFPRQHGQPTHAPIEPPKPLPLLMPAGAAPLVEPLSEREREVLQLLADGMSNQQIAHRLIVSVGTVKTHVMNIYSKLNVHSRTQAIARARSLNLMDS